MKRLVTFLALLLVLSCASNQFKNQEATETLHSLVEEKSINIISDWADPQYTQAMSQVSSVLFSPGNTNVTGRIDISSHNNYFIFKNDSVKARFPYYGERHSSSSYNNIDQGITFKGVPKDFALKKEGNIYKMTFSITDSNFKNERYDVTVLLNGKLKSIIDINSTHRMYIRYLGRIKADQKDFASL